MQWKRDYEEIVASSIYQDPRWLETIEAVYPKLNVKRVACLGTNDKLEWMLPLVEIKPLGRIRPMLISLPFGNYGGILTSRERHNKNKDIFTPSINEYFKDNRAFAIELREPNTPIHGMSCHSEFSRFEITFPEDVDLLWKKVISGNARTSVRKADKLGVNVTFDHKNAVEIFQKIYELNASYHGTPIHKANWYLELYKRFREESDVVLAEQDGEYIGALWILNYQGTSILHSAYSDPRYRQVPATDKLLWEAYRRIMENKISNKFDFGRTRQDAGKQFFKKKWGGEEKPIYYCYLVKQGFTVPQILPENPKLKPWISVWQKLPLPVTRWLGPVLRTRIPT
jgi:hypothetical protein